MSSIEQRLQRLENENKSRKSIFPVAGANIVTYSQEKTFEFDAASEAFSIIVKFTPDNSLRDNIIKLSARIFVAAPIGNLSLGLNCSGIDDNGAYYLYYRIGSSSIGEHYKIHAIATGTTIGKLSLQIS